MGKSIGEVDVAGGQVDQLVDRGVGPGTFDFCWLSGFGPKFQDGGGLFWLLCNFWGVGYVHQILMDGLFACVCARILP
jgi:hypothetical protein